MADTNALPAAVRSLDQMNLIAMWIETIIYGINVVVFGSVVYVLTVLRRKRGNSRINKYLLAVTIFSFSLSTAHVALTMRYLIEAFIVSASIPHGAIFYFLVQTNPLSFVGQILYAINVVTQDLIVIWRLYVVWDSWKIGLCALVVEIAHSTIMFICTIAYSMGKSLDSPIVGRTGMASWSLDLCVNTLGTSAIAARLWWVGRQTASLKPGNRNSYLSIAFIILESGAMFAAATFILVILYVHTPTALGAVAGINVVMQLATLSPLLIIVRVGLNLSHGSSRNNTAYVSAPSNVNIIQANIKPTNSSTPVRVLVSQGEEVDFPRETRKGDYEMHILDSDSYNQKDIIVVDAI